jgi:type II secretory pathway component GspD/PulD (secretin)/tetratricopeptide (TPR) repeat protein
MKTIVLAACGLALFAPPPAWAQADAASTETAVQEGVRREALKIDLRGKLAEARAAHDKGRIFDAAKGYSECLVIVKKIGTGVEEQQKQVWSGFVATRLQLAEQAQRDGNFPEAEAQARLVLKEDPKNEPALDFLRRNDRIRASEEGRSPSADTISKLPALRADQVKAATHVQNGKLLYESGKLEAAAAELRQAVKLDPGNRAATYYLDLVVEQSHRNESNLRDSWSRKMLLDVARAWNDPVKGDQLPIPNSYARTSLVHTSKSRQRIYQKLDSIRLAEHPTADGVGLGPFFEELSKDVKARDPEKKGINFILNNAIDAAPPAAPLTDPATGLLVPVAPGGPEIPIGEIVLKMNPKLTDLTVRQLLDAIVRVADRPIKYSVEDYAIVISHRTPETPTLYSRTFKIDPNTFLQGLQGVVTLDFGVGSGQSSGGGGGGRSGGGGGRSGRSGGGGGGGVGGDSSSGGGAEYVGVSLAPGGGRGGQFGGAGRQAGQPGQAGQTGTGGGITHLTQQTPTEQIITIVRQFFTTAGVDLTTPGKSLYFNDRSGMLLVRATLQELDIIEQAIQVLNVSPPQLTIEAKFAEVTQDDTKALGFDWLLGNTLVGGGKVGVQGGTAPSFGSPTTSGSDANPSGVFPGPLFVNPITGQPVPVSTPGTVFPAASDNVLTSGLRQSAPAIATITGILTDPQFRVVIRALEQRQGVDLLSAPKITTLSSRQAQIKVVDVRYIVTDLDTDQTSSGGGTTLTAGTTTGGGAVGSLIQPLAEPFELGPVLDVVPYVSADGFTVQMTIIPTIKEFIGYDLESAALFTTQVQSVSGNATANPLTQTTPLPIFRLRQVVTSAVVWDGQTVVLGGLISENVTKTKDKVPVMGDLPWVGRFFRSESSMTMKKNLLIFVTPTIIDPAGNRVHSEEELPFARTTIPEQKPVTQ